MNKNQMHSDVRCQTPKSMRSLPEDRITMLMFEKRIGTRFVHERQFLEKRIIGIIGITGLGNEQFHSITVPNMFQTASL